VRVTYALEIDAPVERVFELVEDPEKVKLWTDGLEENAFPPDYDRAHPVGTRFRQAIREAGLLRVYEGEVTAYERLRRYGLRLWNRRLSVEADYRFTPGQRGTRLDYAVDLRIASWLGRLTARLYRHLTEGIVRNQMRRLKRVAEGGGPSTSSAGRSR
jgi:carbon monoxide dehydrogenase subunit G